MTIGVLLALSAMICWAVGDFLTQRATKTLGKFRTMFFSTFVGTFLLTPIVLSQTSLTQVASSHLSLIILTATIALFSAFFNMEAFKQGKISVIEPILGFELPITIIFSVIFLKEVVTTQQLLIIAVIFIGILMAVTRGLTLKDGKSGVERGVFYAGIGAIGLALGNFMVGLTSRETSPIVAFATVQLALFTTSMLVLYWRGHFQSLPGFFKSHYKLIIGLAIFNNFGWLSYGYAVRHIPLHIAISISEAYIALATLLGVFVNKEKLTVHQGIGIFLAIAGVIFLAAIIQ